MTPGRINQLPRKLPQILCSLLLIAEGRGHGIAGDAFGRVREPGTAVPETGAVTGRDTAAAAGAGGPVVDARGHREGDAASRPC